MWGLLLFILQFEECPSLVLQFFCYMCLVKSGKKVCYYSASYYFTTKEVLWLVTGCLHCNGTIVFIAYALNQICVV